MQPALSNSLIRVFICVALTLLCGGCINTGKAPSHSDAPLSEQSSISDPVAESYVHEPTEMYTVRSYHGFTVMISNAAMNHPETTDPAIDLLDIKLAQVISLTPKHTHAELRKVRFWIEQHNPGFPCACYHPDAQWLEENGYNTEKAGGIEITNCEHFVLWTERDQPFMVLHELSHAYHHRVLGYENQQIIDAYQHALASGKYESVEHVSGEKRRHYGLNNPQEYFAELSESYFGRNDFYPFTRDELMSFDPEGFDMVEQAWGVR